MMAYTGMWANGVLYTEDCLQKILSSMSGRPIPVLEMHVRPEGPAPGWIFETWIDEGEKALLYRAEIVGQQLIQRIKEGRFKGTCTCLQVDGGGKGVVCSGCGEPVSYREKLRYFEGYENPLPLRYYVKHKDGNPIHVNPRAKELSLVLSPVDPNLQFRIMEEIEA